MNDITINWKEYFDNSCKGEDAWGHYKTAKGDLYVVVDGVSNHEGTRTGADVARFIDDILKEAAPNLENSRELRALIHAINTISTKINKGAYAAIAGILVSGVTVYSFSAGDVAIIAKKANGKLIQILPLDLNVSREEAAALARMKFGSLEKSAEVDEQNVEQRIRQYMHHGLSNAIGIGDTFVLHEKKFTARDKSAILIATDGITDPFIAPQTEAARIPKAGAPKLYKVINSNPNAEAAANALGEMIWDTQVKEGIKIKSDDRTALFIYMDSPAKEYTKWITDLLDLTNDTDTGNNRN